MHSNAEWLAKFYFEDQEKEQGILKLIEAADSLKLKNMQNIWLDSLWYKNEIFGLGKYFVENDIAGAKEKFYLSGRLCELLVNDCDNNNVLSVYSNRIGYALLSDNHALIQRYANLKDSKYAKHIEIGSLVVTIQLVIKESWDELYAMMDRFSFLIEKRKEKWRLPDRTFFLGLLNQDKSQMENGLQELVSKRVHNSRSRHTSKLIQNYVSHPALGYAKLAWLKGYEVKVDSPLVPKELLPVCPLVDYQDYNFSLHP